MSAKARGSQRERDVKKLREGQGWVVTKAGGSFGAGDLACMKAGRRNQLIQVKATAAGPYAGFGPADRQELLDDAEKADADALECWWPFDRQGPRWLLPGDWP